MSLNTVDQQATIYVEDPVEIDFDEVGEQCVSAAFTVTGMELRSRGQVVVAQCERCSEEHGVLQMEGSEQQFHLAEPTEAWSESRPFTANVMEWREAQPSLELLP